VSGWGRFGLVVRRGAAPEHHLFASFALSQRLYKRQIDRELYYKEVIKGLGEKMLKDFRRIKESPAREIDWIVLGRMLLYLNRYSISQMARTQ
jgi:hypothetical protein